jgi:uncharacterized repeat protein (TIGR01451 family)
MNAYRPIAIAACAIAIGCLLWLAAAPAHAATCPTPANDILSPSCFEGGDGNLAPDTAGRSDWSTVSGEVPLTDPTGANENTFGGGSKEQDPTSWSLVNNGAPQKSDILGAALYTDPVSGHIFLYGAFYRLGNTGTTNLSFELNRSPGLWDNDNNPSTPPIPERSDGDMLITFDTSGSSVATVGACLWHGDRRGEAAGSAFGWYTLPGFGAGGTKLGNQDSCTTLSGTDLATRSAFGAMNTATLTNNGALPGFPSTMVPNTFGEMAVDLTKALSTVANPNPCFDFGSLWMHSRSSTAPLSQMQDYVGPSSLIKAQSCKIAIDKQVAVNGGAFNQGLPTDPSYASAGDTLNYKLLVTNPGEAPISSVSISDPGCSGLSDPAKLTGADPDATPGTLDPGDTWVYTCSHAYAAGDPSPYTNTATATGYVGFKQLSATDSASTGRFPTVTVIKHVVNDNGGTATAGDFTINVNAPGATPTSFPGADSPGTTVTVDPGDYNVDEGAHAGYTETRSAGCWGTIGAGESRTCTITNDDIAPKLTVVKHVVNDDGGTAKAGDFTMNVTGTNVSSASFPGDENGTTVTLDQGTYSVDEGWYAGYAKSLSGDCSGTIAVGETKTCTITNDDIGARLIVKKDVVNDNGGTAAPGDFTLHVNADGASPGTFKGNDQGTQVALQPGAYSVGEDASPGYAESQSAGCSGSIGIGETKYCTVTNDDIAPKLTVVKHVDNGAFDGGAVASDFTMSVDAANASQASFAGDENGTTITLDAGHYSVGESGAQTAHYAATRSADCDGTIAIGESKTCTITNTRKATLIVHKVTDPVGSSPKFAFSTTIPGPDGNVAFQLAGGETFTQDDITPGQSYSVTEQDAKALGYKLTDLACTQRVPDGQQAAPRLKAVDGTYTFRADTGDLIECTYTNTKVNTALQVKKTGPAFAYSGDTLTFGYAVTNTGNEPLSNIAVSDDKCPNVQGPVSRANDNGDDVLDPGETWNYTCSYVITHHQGDPNPVTNIATATGVDQDQQPVTATDRHDTRILHPAIGIRKTGPATAQAGALVPYTLAVTNPGDVSFAQPLVVVTDGLCEAPPALRSTNGDPTPATFDPGDTWTYACSVQTLVGQTRVDNVAGVKGTDGNGRSVTASAMFVTQLTQPQISVAPEEVTSPKAGSARLRGPVGCPIRATTAVVTGKRIAKVVFYVDGKKVKTVTHPDANGRWSLRIVPNRLRYGSHKVTVKVTFVANTKAKSKTLKLSFTRCHAAILKPKFTG